jgi:hypothetical protein
MIDTKGLTDEVVYQLLPPQHCWVYDKLLIAKHENMLCGPADSHIPVPGKYIVRPITNMSGMSSGAYIIDVGPDEQPEIPLGYFWCEYVHDLCQYSIDFEYGEQKACFEGYRGSHVPLWRFDLWRMNEEYRFKLPNYLLPLLEFYSNINVEVINGRVIEVHLRSGHNEMWSHAIPVWADSPPVSLPRYRYIDDYDDADGRLNTPRMGFLVK